MSAGKIFCTVCDLSVKSSTFSAHLRSIIHKSKYSCKTFVNGRALKYVLSIKNYIISYTNIVLHSVRATSLEWSCLMHNYAKTTVCVVTNIVGTGGLGILCRPPCRRSPGSRSAIGIYLAAQQSFYDISLEYLIAPSTLRSIIKVTCDKLWCVLQPLYMAEKTNEDWIKIAKQFNIRAGFPNVIGAIDGKHIRIEKPNNAGSEDFNYKKYFLVVLMAWVDADYKFVFVDIGSYGSSSDSTIFKNSNIGKRLEQGTLNIPSGNTLPGDESGRVLPYYVIGDEAFGLSKNISRPYAKRDLNIVKKVFNYRLTRARRYVECTFGILANKWRILHRPLDVNREFCDSIIKACCILHNYVRDHDGIEFKDTVYDCPLTDYNSNNSAMSSGNDIRQYLCSYFVSTQGSLPWQYDKI